MPFKADAQLLKTKLDQEKAVWDVADARAAKAKADGGDDKAVDEAAKPTQDELTQLKQLQTEINELDTKCAESKEYEAIRDANEAKRTALSTPVNRPDFGNLQAKARNGDQKSMGQLVTDSPEFKSWLKAVAPEGSEVNTKIKLESPEVDLKALVMTTPGTAGGSFVRRDYGPWPIDLPLRPLTIRDVITILRTGSNLIEYIRVNALTRAAAIVPEATSITDDAALKPQAGMEFELVQTGVKTIAVWMPITRTILSDVPQLESMVDSFLDSDLELELEEEVIAGPGGANHFTGLENTPNLTPQPFVVDALDSTGGMLTTTRKARTKVRVVGRANPTGYLLNPYDWETIDLARGAQGQFYFGGPMQMGTKMLWGLPVIESEVIPQGTGYTGDLKQMVVWDRERPTLRVTDSNRDFFERNIISILREERAAFGVLRPPAIVKIDLHAGANS